MSRLCWVFVLLAVVVVVPSDARPHNCQQRERSLADLDLAKDALSKAQLFYPNWEDENASSNSSECSKRDKSLGFIDVALDLISNAKKNIQICPPVPTEEPFTTTEDPTTKITKKDFRIPMDCQDLQDKGLNQSGVYTVWPRGQKSGVQVRCDMDTDEGGWTVIQRRGNFLVQENFDRDWKDYKNGFGDLRGDFWIGNDNIFALTSQGNYSLRMDMTGEDGEIGYALFQEFWIEDENATYRLHVGGYKGSHDDGMSDSDGQMFTTKDRDNDNSPDRNCAEDWKGAFWYDNCALCNPNGLYNPREERTVTMFYGGYALGRVSMEMKVKRLP